MAYEVELVKRVRDADGAACKDCESWFDRYSNLNLPWTWKRSKWMHERGTGHRMELYRIVGVVGA